MLLRKKTLRCLISLQFWLASVMVLVILVVLSLASAQVVSAECFAIGQHALFQFASIKCTNGWNTRGTHPSTAKAIRTISSNKMMVHMSLVKRDLLELFSMVGANLPQNCLLFKHITILDYVISMVELWPPFSHSPLCPHHSIIISSITKNYQNGI